MRRRTFLAGLLGSTAGCLGSDGSGGPATTTTDTTTQTMGSTTGNPTRNAGPRTYRLENLETTQQTDGPEYRYVLTSTASYSATAVEREENRTGENRTVVPLASIDSDPVREAISTAVDTGTWCSNALPDGLRETVDESDFFVNRSNGENATRIGLSLFEEDPDAPPTISFDAGVLDPEVMAGSPGALELSLTNDGSDEAELVTGTMPPFGVVFVDDVGGDGTFLLWRPYERGDCVSFEGDSVFVCDVGRFVTIQSGETIAKRYEVLPSTTDTYPEHTVPPDSGTYQHTNDLTYTHQPLGAELKLSIQFRFDLV